MTYFFTSDTHFDHTNIIKYCNRPFVTVEEMNATIIARWNERVKKGDTVYHLGDFSVSPIECFMKQLNGEVILLPGSHDRNGSTRVSPIVELVLDQLSDEYGHRRLIVLCHYSMRSWNISHYGSWHLFGHHHGKLEPYGLSFDVGVDTNNFYPYSLDDVAAKMATLQPIVDYRKNPRT